ncbi:hypothetical protein T08_6649 [Trichinella sp. T8]|nr:hypothetical protein T08_6649 [Trichinella sp. T8]
MRQSASGDLLLWDVTLNFGETNLEQSGARKQEIRLNAYLEMVLQQMTERVLQTISRFMARQGSPPQWNYEEKRNVWSLATSRRHCVERKPLPAI